MKGLRNILLILLVPFVASGCATTNQGITCGVIGAGLGGTAGGLVAEKAIAGIIPGAAVGAALGYMICRDGDADNDGIPDSQDLCPDTPEGANVNESGCSDADGDGVADTADQCPNTPEDLSVDAAGCPPDSDGDGVGDYADECPSTLPGIKVKSNGCAECGQLLATVESVGFDFNKATLRRDNATTDTLTRVVEAIKNTDTVVRIAGHTDSIGDNNYNLTLSKARAKTVSGYLTSRGVMESNISAVVGKGEASPVASNRTTEGRAKNRRVEITADCGQSAM